MGIEIPNISRQIVSIRSILESDSYVNSAQKLPLALGVTINGENVVADLAKMPHLLIAGTTGSGKSVAINTMIISLIYSLDYNKCKFIMIDPKMLELSLYNDIPHLITPVVTDPKKAVIALKWVVAEMEARYRLMSQLGVRNIDGYNQKIDKSIENNETIRYKTQSGFDESGKPIFKEVIVPAKHMPTIIVIVDEMADLMLLAGKEIESLVQRLAQMARAAGIHIIMATQRPSVDVITGVIKANFPTRISFAVTSKIDSRTILGEQGAESLLGMGDMLYMSSGGKTQRLHGPFISDKEIQAVLNDIKNQAKPCYLSEISTLMESISNNVVNSWDEEDGLYAQAVTIVKRDRKASISYLQRQLKIGFNRAASLIERMEKEGIVSEQNGMGKRTVVIT
ncbi:DNA segregation ATPase FtsK/SpoIIIE, S-DNA-T family [Candidatus Xenohaliotis californiensis]|uniref:DNA segregation ATPase FtsK/SpoIIIE, S-DNA-T family n=1 Tax=Candidatus Xenohaliotis californiensis TaxID=84677 RepID=A0ABM9N948_9RICK|nr:DNA segregation ATPase FtsK/SpoIIIE, S-DNA-T family [Candidatus Xenohaliotis californiensis]